MTLKLKNLEIVMQGNFDKINFYNYDINFDNL